MIDADRELTPQAVADSHDRLLARHTESIRFLRVGAAIMEAHGNSEAAFSLKAKAAFEGEVVEHLEASREILSMTAELLSYDTAA